MYSKTELTDVGSESEHRDRWAYRMNNQHVYLHIPIAWATCTFITDLVWFYHHTRILSVFCKYSDVFQEVKNTLKIRL